MKSVCPSFRSFVCCIGLAIAMLILFASCQYHPPGIPLDAKRIRAGFWQKQTAQEQIMYYPDGKVYLKGSLKNGIAEGLWQYFSHDGKVTTSGRYTAGLREGLWVFRNSAGGLYQELRYAPEPKRLDYLLLSGNKVGNENGPYKRYYESGILEEEGSYVGGSKEGKTRRYYPTGQLASEGSYHKDQKDGLWLYYFPDGRLKRRESYRAGRLHGKLTNYYPDGSLYNEAFYQNGARDGEVRIVAPRRTGPS